MLNKVNVRNKPMFETKQVSFMFEDSTQQYPVNCWRPPGTNLLIQWGKRSIRKEGYWTPIELAYPYSNKSFFINVSPVAVNNTTMTIGSSDDNETNTATHSTSRFSLSVYPALARNPYAFWFTMGQEA